MQQEPKDPVIDVDLEDDDTDDGKTNKADKDDESGASVKVIKPGDKPADDA